MTRGNFGIDMVSGTASDFRLESVQGWSIKPGNRVGEDNEPWGVCVDGSYLSGSGYYINAGRQGELSGRIDLTKRGLTYTYNPSTLEHPWQLTTDLTNTAEAIHRDMDTVGVDFDLDRTKLGRLDVTRQQVMSSPCRAFIPAFTAMQGKRMKSVQYPDGYTFGNKSRRAVFYDKTRQARTVKGEEGVPPNLLRCELRAFRNKTIGHTERGFGMGTFGQVREADTDNILHTYSRTMEASVFRYDDGKQMALDFGNEAQLLSNLREESPRGAIDYYLAMEGLEGILSRFGGLETFGECLVVAGYSDRNVRRHLSRLRDMMHTKAFVDRRRKQTTVATQIDLLRNTFTA